MGKGKFKSGIHYVYFASASKGKTTRIITIDDERFKLNNKNHLTTMVKLNWL